MFRSNFSQKSERNSRQRPRRSREEVGGDPERTECCSTGNTTPGGSERGCWESRMTERIIQTFSKSPPSLKSQNDWRVLS